MPHARALVATLFVVALGLALLAPGAATASTFSLGPDGTTADVFDYHAATRERVYIPQFGVDQDANGVADVIAIEIMRPTGADPGSVPAIIDPSPYYTTVCRGNEGQCIGDTNSDGVNDKWPLFLDNYFVPRGYAVILAESDGTANSTGCPLHGGPGDIQGMRSVIDWLNGRIPGYRDAGLTQIATATWHNGKAAMIGKSYDGTLTEGVAATGVSGLTTIVPESAIDDWYTYSRMGGIRFNTHYPRSLSTTITDVADRPACAAAYASLDSADGDATGDRNVFWEDRNYLKDVGNVHASVLAVHGLQDDNVRMDNLATWWAGLKVNSVPRKLWLMRAGHVDPFDLRRDVWVDTLHKWFDHWLYGIDNDIMSEPAVDIQAADKTWSTAPDWPVPGTASVDLHLRATTQAAAGALGFTPGDGADSVTWTDPTSSQSEATMMNAPTGAQTARRVFLSAPLKQDLRISGVPVVHMKAALSTTQSNLGALVVDYGASTQVTRNLDGIANTTTRTCWGDDDTALSGDYSACYLEVNQPTAPVTQWRVTKGILDSSNRSSLSVASLVTAGTPTDFPMLLLPQDHVFAAGHQIGVILVGDYSGFSSVRAIANATITLDTKASTITLPVVGGAAAAAASGGFDTITPTLTVPDDQAVTATSAAGATVSWPAPAVSDDQDPSPAVVCDPASGSTFPVGASTVTCTATDASGNATTGTFTVTVAAQPITPDDEPPAGGQTGDGGQTIGGQTIGGTPASTGPAPATTAPPVAAPPAAQPAATTAIDNVPVALTALKLSGRAGRVLATFRLSGTATVTVTLKRHGAQRATKTAKVKLKAGKRSIALKARALRAGRYDVTIAVRSTGGVVKTLHRTLTVRAG